MQRTRLLAESQDYQKAAAAYEQVDQLCRENVDALKAAAKLYHKCGQVERSICILEDYLKSIPDRVNAGVVDLLGGILMEIKAHDRALRYIEQSQVVGEELPLNLKVKAGICHVHLGNMEMAQVTKLVIILKIIYILKGCTKSEPQPSSHPTKIKSLATRFRFRGYRSTRSWKLAAVHVLSHVKTDLLFRRIGAWATRAAVRRAACPAVLVFVLYIAAANLPLSTYLFVLWSLCCVLLSGPVCTAWCSVTVETISLGVAYTGSFAVCLSHSSSESWILDSGASDT
ncbi:general transcription factor 3c polypeptide 3-like [Trifolium pratense]|uniref:General transcription factor 3c polypeptide 3-like n=1 Tax=Trifolium pratense TaxID=57577 RepID=A0A2K3NT46_TRIPR|nr:general transcription factor 3c polypeptide 3-like [Trifolium pratense]